MREGSLPPEKDALKHKIHRNDTHTIHRRNENPAEHHFVAEERRDFTVPKV